MIAIKTAADSPAPTPGEDAGVDVTAARVDGKTLTVIFDAALNTESKPASSAFAVIATEARREPHHRGCERFGLHRGQ